MKSRCFYLPHVPMEFQEVQMEVQKSSVAFPVVTQNSSDPEQTQRVWEPLCQNRSVDLN